MVRRPLDLLIDISHADRRERSARMKILDPNRSADGLEFLGKPKSGSVGEPPFFRVEVVVDELALSADSGSRGDQKT